MAFVQLTGISLAFGDRDILKDINFNLSSKSRVALAGPNGSGKSTLMKIMAGLQHADSGDIVAQKDSRVSYLPQSGIVHQGSTLREEAEQAFSDFHSVLARKEEVERLLGEVKHDGPETDQLLHEHNSLEEHLLSGGFYSREERIESVLEGLGFLREDLDRDTAEFSGGWQMRIALAKILLLSPDVLLLDEPTNYLDIEARTWLEGYLNRLGGGYLIVSHDRYFLDVTVGEVAELWNGKLKIYRGNYTGYEKARKEEVEQLVARYEAQVAEIAKTQEFINRFRYNASKAAMVQSRIKQLEKIEVIEIPESMKPIKFAFPAAPHSGKQIVMLDGISKSYGELRVLTDLSLNLTRGEKLAIAGRNGAGKSTLMRIIAGVDSEYAGTIRYGTGVSVGYFSQEMESRLDESLQIIQEVERDAPTQSIPSLRNLLGAFLFRGDDIFKPVSVLSGGEKSRVALLKLLLEPTNLLVLDEPTNHLDLRSKDVLLEALQRFAGTLIFVSHDRYFIEALATSVLELGPAGARLFPGDYEYYLWETGERADEHHEAGRKSPQAAAQPAPAVAHSLPKKAKSSQRSLEREQEELVETLDRLEKRQAELMEELAKPSIYTNGEKVKVRKEELDKNGRRQQELSKRWEELDEELHDLTAT
ncbi:MAG TPA: ABC-F family ATP-binding cassette domain-containing protein [Spirochaetia bacterium]|nr:ABC-F family ATP-binding cassette domain-containing protein [Spirochaetia bacterium]